MAEQTQVNLILSSAKPTTQQSIYLLLPMAQGVLSLTAKKMSLMYTILYMMKL